MTRGKCAQTTTTSTSAQTRAPQRTTLLNGAPQRSPQARPPPTRTLIPRPASTRAQMSRPAPTRTSITRPAPTRAPTSRPNPTRARTPRPTTTRGPTPRPAPTRAPSSPTSTTASPGLLLFFHLTSFGATYTNVETLQSEILSDYCMLIYLQNSYIFFVLGAGDRLIDCGFERDMQCSRQVSLNDRNRLLKRQSVS